MYFLFEWKPNKHFNDFKCDLFLLGFLSDGNFQKTFQTVRRKAINSLMRLSQTKKKNHARLHTERRQRTTVEECFYKFFPLCIFDLHILRFQSFSNRFLKSFRKVSILLEGFSFAFATLLRNNFFVSLASIAFSV